MLVGCGPSVTSMEASGSASGDTTASSSSTSTTSGDDSQSGGAASTGASADACNDFPIDACPSDCQVREALQVLDDACGVSPVPTCVSVGAVYEGRPTTYFLPDAAGPLFIEVGGECGDDVLPGQGWTECGGLAAHPEDCACFCSEGYCPGSEDVQLLDACGLPSPCAPLLVSREVGATDHDNERCILEHLRDRVDGVYDVVSSGGELPLETQRLYVYGGRVARVQAIQTDVMDCPLQQSSWGPAEGCEPAAPEFFTDCLEGALAPDCVLQLENWVSQCSSPAAPCSE